MLLCNGTMDENKSFVWKDPNSIINISAFRILSTLPLVGSLLVTSKSDVGLSII